MIALSTNSLRVEPRRAVLPVAAQRISMPHERRRSRTFVLWWLLLSFLAGACASAQAQTFRFSLRAEPDIIPANGISTSTILVQVQNTANAGIGSAPLVRFLTTRGTIERQARLTGGVARVLLRSTTTP